MGTWKEHPTVAENWKIESGENTHTHTDSFMFLEANICDLPNFTIMINILACSKSIFKNFVPPPSAKHFYLVGQNKIHTLSIKKKKNNINQY